MCSPNDQWGQLLLFPELNLIGSTPNGDVQCSTSRPGAEESLPSTEMHLNFELTCKCTDVTLTKRLTLPLSVASSAKGGSILGACVAELISDAKALAG